MAGRKNSKSKIRFYRNSSHGFTLPELMIAIAVLTIAIVGLLSAFSYSMLANIRARDLTRATMHAQYILEHLQCQDSASDIDDLLEDYDGDPYDWIDFAQNDTLLPAAFEILSEEDIEVYLLDSETIGSAKLFNLEVVVKWQDSRVGAGVGPNQSISCATEISK